MTAQGTAEVLAEGDAFEEALSRVESEIIARYEADGAPAPLAIIGVRTGGAHLAKRLVERIATRRDEKPPLGLLDITLYRDDILSGRHPAPLLRGTEIAFDVHGRYLVLVDDVLFTGRTIRAALDALLDLGRPRAVRLAVLADRGLRELPIAPDACGLLVDTSADDHVEVALTETGAERDQILVTRT